MFIKIHICLIMAYAFFSVVIIIVHSLLIWAFQTLFEHLIIVSIRRTKNLHCRSCICTWIYIYTGFWYNWSHIALAILFLNIPILSWWAHCILNILIMHNFLNMMILYFWSICLVLLIRYFYRKYWSNNESQRNYNMHDLLLIISYISNLLSKDKLKLLKICNITIFNWKFHLLFLIPPKFRMKVTGFGFCLFLIRI